MLRRLKNWIKKIFSSKKPIETTTEKPTDIIIEIPKEESTEKNIGSIYGIKSPDYADLWSKCYLDKERIDQVLDNVRIILKNKDRYEYVSRALGGKIPYYFIAALHYRESSLDFSGVLHNGQRILGTGKVTTWVPKGRGPFETWEESAIDALMLKNYHKLDSWTIAECLERSERYNGLGYRSRIGDKGKLELSPYVFAGTNLHDENSKYTSDGKYSPTAPEKQLGVAAIYLGLAIK